jgi:hypothetical protein
MKKKILILGLAMLFSTASVFAQCIDLEWTIKDSTLIISGEGAIPDFTGPKDGMPPWFDWGGVYGFTITSIVIENGITRIGNYAFFDLRNATSASIPSSVTSIGESAFSYCGALTLITNYNPVPVAINESVFYGVDKSACTLEVPRESVKAYENAEVWKEFNIVGVDVAIEPIEDLSIKIHPNPTTGKVYIETESVIKVYNQKGALLQETFGNQVDLSDYPQGVYMLQVNGNWTKVVKQ